MTSQNPFANSVDQPRVARSAQVITSRPMTPTQKAAVDRAYSHFKLNTQTMAGGYLVRNVVLSDGSKVRMESNLGIDRIFVDPVGGGRAPPLLLAGYNILPADKNNTLGWGTPKVAMIPAEDTLKLPPSVKLHSKTQAGVVNWIGPEDLILSYDHGGKNRYSTERWGLITYVTWIPTDGSSGIYYKGTRIETPGGVSACAVYDRWLVVLVGDALHSCPSPIEKIDKALAAGLFPGEISPTWDAVTITGSPTAARRCSAWHFKPDGSRAACAVMYTAGVTGGLWTLERSMTESLPQAKRYLDLSMDGSGNLLAALSDTAYATEPWASYINGALVTAATGSTTVGALTFAGKRLWGVDYTEDGTEIEVSCRREGTGASTRNVSGASPAPVITTVTLTWDVSWGVYANEDEIFKASYVLPGATNVTTDSTTEYSASAEILNEYVAVHAIDARFRAAIIEKLAVTYPGAVTATNDSSGIPATAATVECKLQYLFDGAVEGEEDVVFDSTYMPPVVTSIDVRNPVFVGRYGMSHRRTGVSSNPNNISYSYWIWFPQIGDYDCENIYEQIWDNSSGLLNRDSHSTFDAYPNQVTDFLSKMYWQYTVQINVYAFTVFWDTTRLGAFNSSNTTQSSLATAHSELGRTNALYNGLGIRTRDPLHWIAAGKDAFTNQFFDSIKRMHQNNQGVTQSGRGYTYFASAFTRDSTSDPWSEDNLLKSYVRDKTDAETGVTVDADSFHFDPVKVI